MRKGDFSLFIYGRQSGRCVGSRKRRKKIMRNVKKGSI